MSVFFFIAFILILGRMLNITMSYILMDWTKEIEEKEKLIKIAYTMYYSTIVATLCYVNSLYYAY